MDEYTITDWAEEIMLEADRQEDETRYDGAHPNGLAELLLAYPGTREELVGDAGVGKLMMMMGTAVYHISHVGQDGDKLRNMLCDLCDQARLIFHNGDYL